MKKVSKFLHLLQCYHKINDIATDRNAIGFGELKRLGKFYRMK